MVACVSMGFNYLLRIRFAVVFGNSFAWGQGLLSIVKRLISILIKCHFRALCLLLTRLMIFFIELELGDTSGITARFCHSKS